MKPEDITGIDSRGFLIHVDGCSCDYNEVTRREWVPDSQPLALEVTIERPIFHVDPSCGIHR